MASVKRSRWHVRVDGAEVLAKMFKNLEEEAPEILDNSVKKGAEFVLDEAQRRVPIRTGKLKESLEIQAEKNKKISRKGYKVQSKGVSKGGVRYAFAVERGIPSRKIKAQPFLRPSVDENATKIRQIINTELTNSIDKVIER